MRGLDRRPLPHQRQRPVEGHRLLTAARRGGAVVVILAVAVALAAGNPTDPEAPVAAKPAQRHTPVVSSPAATATSAPLGEAAIHFTAPVDPTPLALAAYYGRRVTWTRCADIRQDDCGRVRVPVDYSHPRGKTITIALRRVPAASGKPKGTLFINPGGPGGSGVTFAANAASFFGKAVLRSWDVVGFDPRGMGASAGFDCLTDADLDAKYGADPTPRTAAGRSALVQAAKGRLAACQRRGGELASHMGTEDVARDLDILRDAVGDERLSYYGVSYGTLIGAVYAELFTSRVGLMVLDSAVSPNGLGAPDLTQRDVDEIELQYAVDFDKLWARFVKACNKGHKCPVGRDAKAAAATVIRLLDRLETRPMPTVFSSLPRLTEGWAVTGISEGLRDESSWPYLVDALDATLNDGSGSDLAWFAMVSVGRKENGTYPGASFGKNHLPVTCTDWRVTSWDTSTPDPAIYRSHALFARIMPREPAECLGWRGPTRDNLLVSAQPQTPILVIGNKDDPVTSIDTTSYLSEMLVGSRFVSVDASGHGAYGNGNACADKVVDEYLVRGIPPRPAKVCPAG